MYIFKVCVFLYFNRNLLIKRYNDSLRDKSKKTIADQTAIKCLNIIKCYNIIHYYNDDC